ncbi:MAG: hypothetical protein M3Y60_02945 [Bacteroidota bacterium]|nr:hypothetical protein [Bacteroidota bacterium]
MDAVHFVCVWRDPAAPEVAMVQDMWRKYGVITGEEMIAKRASEIVFVIRGKNGEVGGVSTVRPVRAKFLNYHFFYEFRCFIAPHFRAPGLDSLLAKKTGEFLEKQNDSVSKFKGMLMIVENQALRVQRTKAVWPASGMVFIGYTSQGHHIRVGYFKGARI